MSNRIIHCNNFCILGGIESLVMDMSRLFPQYQHVLLTVNSANEQLDFVRYLQEQGIKYFNADGKVTEAMLEGLDPMIVFLHNTRGECLEGEWPYEWLQRWRVVGVHHASTWPLITADADWFVSDYVRRPYARCESRIKDGFTMPPCIDERPFLEVQRPSRLPVVGRIQSSTGLRHGKVPEKFFELLERVRGCSYFVVTSNGLTKSRNGRPRFKFAPIRPGAMPGYLAEVDVFAIWGETSETWSRVVTEANLSGIPVVARDHKDGLTEQLRKSGGGWLVETEDEFVEAVQRLVDDESERRKLGQRGRSWCMENASSKALKDRFLEKFLEWSVNGVGI